MSTAAARPGLEEVRQYHLARLNDALRRPGMWGGEITLQLTMDSVAFIDGARELWELEQQRLRATGAFTPTGVRGGLTAIMPNHDDAGAIASVYADVAWRCGWLTVDRTLPGGEFRRLGDEVVRWCARDRHLEEVLAELGTPSLWLGGTNPRYPKTLAYATSDRDQGLICLHFASTYDWNAPQPQPVLPPVLLAVRHGSGVFADTFTFTPAGATYRAEDHDETPSDQTASSNS